MFLNVILPHDGADEYDQQQNGTSPPGKTLSGSSDAVELDMSKHASTAPGEISTKVPTARKPAAGSAAEQVPEGGEQGGRPATAAAPPSHEDAASAEAPEAEAMTYNQTFQQPGRARTGTL